MSDSTPAGAAAAALAETTVSTNETPTTTTTTQPTNGNEQPTSGPEWASGWELDPEDQGYLEKRAWKTPKDLLKSYRELERTMSNDKIVLPKDGADPKEWDAVYAKLGRPDSPDKYTAPRDADEALFKALAPDLHGAGLTQAQLDKVTEGYNKYVQSAVAEQQNAWLKDQDTAQSKLEAEWGARTPQEIEHNRRAMRALGISVADATEYMKHGSEKFLRLLNMAGHMIAEDNSGDIMSDTTLGFGLTPQRAASELQELRNNKDFMDRVRSGEPVAKQKYNRLVGAAADAGYVRNTVRGNYKQNR